MHMKDMGAFPENLNHHISFRPQDTGTTHSEGNHHLASCNLDNNLQKQLDKYRTHLHPRLHLGWQRLCGHC